MSIALAAPARGASDFVSLGISWTAQLDSPVVASPAIDADRVYLPLRTGKVRALALSSGAEVWTIDVPVTAGLTIDGPYLVGVTERALVGLEAATGRTLWTVPLSGAGFAPSARGGWVLVAVDHDLLAFTAADGRLVWRLPFGAAARAQVTIDGDRVYVPLDDGSLAAVDIMRGAALWRVRLPAPAGAVTAAGDRLYVGCADNFFYALDAEDGDRDWRWRAAAAVLAPTAFDAHRVYYTALDNVVRGVDAGSGVLKWRYAMETRPLAGPRIDDDVLILAAGAELRAIRAADGTLAGRWTAPAELASAPAFVPSAPQAGRAAQGAAASPGDGVRPEAGGARVVIVTGATTGDWRVYGLGRSLEPAPLPLKETPGRPLSPDVPPALPGPPRPGVPLLL